MTSVTADHVIERYAAALEKARTDLTRGVGLTPQDAMAVRGASRSHTTLDEKAVLLTEARHPGLQGLALASLLYARQHATRNGDEAA